MIYQVNEDILVNLKAISSITKFKKIDQTPERFVVCENTFTITLTCLEDGFKLIKAWKKCHGEIILDNPSSMLK